MSWPQWSSGNQPPVPTALTPATPVINSAPAVGPPGLQYSPEQWAQLQQQNWNQWAQWQQQYQQWHQQYGAEYQKSINALAAQAQQPVAPLPNVAVPPPLPAEPKPQPPLPTEDPPPGPSYNSVQPPQPPPQQQGYNTAPKVSEQRPPVHYPKSNQNSNWQNQNYRYGPDGQQNKRAYEQGPEHEAKRPMLNRPGWQTQPPPQIRPRENIEELSEAEKKFDKQFAEWEAQFNKWKEQNVEHPDKEQYREYEKKWESWRAQLLERREQMKRKRLGLTVDSPNRGRPGSGQGFNQPNQSYNSPQQAFTQPQGGFNQAPPQKYNQQPPLKPPNVGTAKAEALLPTPSGVPPTPFDKPPPNLNDEPLKFKDNKPVPELQDDVGDFIKPNTGGGIPGLDLVKDEPKPPQKSKDDVVVIDPEEKQRKGPDLDAISKGINTILGDQKLLNMLSMVSQTQPKTTDNLTNTTSSIKDTNIPEPNLQAPYPEQSNQSNEDHSIHSEGYGQREFVNNFDDQTRSSFTMNHNEHEPRFEGPGGPPNLTRGQNQFPERFDNFRGNRENEFNRDRFPPNGGPNQFGPRGDRFVAPEDKFGPNQDRFVAPDDRFGLNQDRFGANQEKFGPNQDRFGTNQGRFGSNQDRFGPNQDRIGPNQERLGPNQNRYGPNQDRFGAKQDRFGPDQDRFGSNEERFGSNQDRFTPKQDRLGPNQDRLGPNEDRLGPNQEKLGLNQERLGPNQDRFTPNQDRFAPNQDRFGPNQDRFGPNQERFGSNQDKFGTNQDRLGDKFGPNQGRIGSGPDKFGTNQDKYGSGQDRFGPNQDRFGPNQDRFGLNQNRLGPNQDKFGPNKDHLDMNQDKFGPGGDKFGSGGDKFGPGGDKFGPGGDKFGPGGDKFGPGGDKFGPGGDKFGSGGDKFGPGGDKFGSGGDKFGPSQDRFGSNQDKFGPNQGRFGFNQDKFGSNQDRFGPNQEKFGPNQERFGPNQDKFGSNQDKFGPNQEKFGPNQERFGANQERFGANQERFGANQERFGPNQDRFGPNQDRFGPNQDIFGPNQDRFGSHQDRFGPNQNRFGSQRNAPDDKFSSRNDRNPRGFDSGDNYNKGRFDNNYKQYEENLDDYDYDSIAASFEKEEPNTDVSKKLEEPWKEDSDYPQESFNESDKGEPVPPAPPQIDNLFHPAKVIDYEHKSIKSTEPEVLIEPIYMFDYRHKALSRIPLPQRPKWLSEAVKNIREFDPPVVRPYEPPNLRRYPSSDNWRNDRYQENWAPHRGRSYDERPFDDRRPYNDRPLDSRGPKNDWKKNYNDDKNFYPEERKQPIQSMDFEEEKFSDTEWPEDDELEEQNISDFPKFQKPNENKPNTHKSVVSIEDLISPPGRYKRPPRIVIILRGPPGSGKTFLAKLIKDKEVENGGSAPRILSLDDYFMVEQEKEVTEEGKKVTVKEMVYEYEAEMEESYRTSLIKSFKKTITDGYFSFIIVDNVNDKVKYFGEMWSFAKQNGFQVYICQLDLDAQSCSKRNIHGRSESDIEKCVSNWEPTPAHHPVLDSASLLQSASIPEVEMEEVNSPESDPNEDDGSEDQVARSKWDNFDCSVDNLAKLDGLSKPLRQRTMEEYLQLDSEWAPVVKPTKPGQKRVRWADLEEQKQQEKMRAIGFVVGHTNWDRMMDPTGGSSALTQTKYIERTGRYKVDQK